jgi:hypothetical protein
VLVAAGLNRSSVDQCVYFQHKADSMTFVTIYVDDLLIFTNDEHYWREVKSILMDNFKMKDIGLASSVLGLRITRDQVNKSIKIDQSQYITEILNRFKMSDANPVKTPVDCGQKLTTDMCPTDAESKAEMAKIPYMEALGSLLFAAQITRPDICYAVNVLSRFGSNPGMPHWTALKRVLRYLKGTVDKCLVYSKTGCDLVGYCDADWAGDVDERRSTTGYVFKMQDGPISWATKRQPTVALSSTEAEVMSVVSATQESIWLQRLQKELLMVDSISLVLYCDNKSAIHVMTNNSYSPRTKHIDIRAKFIAEKLKDGCIKLHYISTHEMLADILTKGVDATKHAFLTNELGLV